MEINPTQKALGSKEIATENKTPVKKPTQKLTEEVGTTTKQAEENAAIVLEIEGDEDLSKLVPNIGMKIASSIITQTRIDLAIAEYDNIHNEIWDNFPEMYALTKNLDGEAPNFDFKDYFKDNTIAQIAAGKIEPWKNVETTKDAIELMDKMMNEAVYCNNIEENGTVSHSEIDSGLNINKGELGVINKVLDELSKINEDTKDVADIYRKALDEAQEKSAEWKQQYKSEHSYTLQEYEDMSKDITEQSDKINSARKKYEAMKKEYLKSDSHTPEETEQLYNKFIDYYIEVNHLVNFDANLNSHVLDNNNIITSSYAKNAIENVHKQIENKYHITFEADAPKPNNSNTQKYSEVTNTTTSTGIGRY